MTWLEDPTHLMTSAARGVVPLPPSYDQWPLLWQSNVQERCASVTAHDAQRSPLETR